MTLKTRDMEHATESGHRYRPLFFFLSGLFFKNSESFHALFVSKFDGLLKPYLAVLIPVALIGFFTEHYALLPSLLSIVWGTGLSLGTGATIAWLQMWFLPHLFLVYFFALAIVVVMNRLGMSVAQKLVVLVTMAAIGAHALPLLRQLSPAMLGLTAIPAPANTVSPGWIFSLDLLPITSAYFLAGYVLAAPVKNLKPNNWVLALTIALFGASHFLFDESINFNSRSYGHSNSQNLGDSAVASVQALCGIYIVLCAAVFIARTGTAARALAFTGSGSLLILIFHAYFQNKVTGVLHHKLGLDMRLSAIAGFAGGVLLPLVIYASARRNRWLAAMLLPSKPVQRLPAATTQAEQPDERNAGRMDVR
jgi:fucose 4-O-acetylase-like acetyltransferase